jgi:hypothetical protein
LHSQPPAASKLTQVKVVQVHVDSLQPQSHSAAAQERQQQHTAGDVSNSVCPLPLAHDDDYVPDDHGKDGAHGCGDRDIVGQVGSAQRVLWFI